MTALVVALALALAAAIVAVLAATSLRRETRARVAAERELFATNTTLLRVLDAAARGALRVERESGAYRVTEVLSRKGAAIYAEGVTIWPRPNLDIGNLLPPRKDTPR